MAPDGEASAGTTIVLVDDDPDIRMLAQMALELDGHLVRASPNGHGGLEQIRHVVAQGRRPVVVLDVQMPDIDGWEVLALIRADEAIAHVPVIMCTVRAGGLDRERGYGLGADAYQAKPFDLEQLSSVVRELVEMDQTALESRRAEISAYIAGDDR